jgi:hypothetical protein
MFEASQSTIKLHKLQALCGKGKHSGEDDSMFPSLDVGFAAESARSEWSVHLLLRGRSRKAQLCDDKKLVWPMSLARP